MMNKQQLAQWLGDLDSRSVALHEIAEILHVVLDASRSSLALADGEELRTLRFAFTILRDVFPRDEDIRAWLARSSTEPGGAAPASVLSLGRVNDFCDLAVAEWNRPREVAMTRHRGIFAARGVSLGGSARSVP